MIQKNKLGYGSLRFVNNISPPHELINPIVENHNVQDQIKKFDREAGLLSLPCVYNYGVKTLKGRKKILTNRPETIKNRVNSKSYRKRCYARRGVRREEGT